VPLDYADNPYPSDLCRNDPLEGHVRRVSWCAPPGGWRDIRPMLQRHRILPGRPVPEDITTQFGAQRHWGKGMLLVPYLLDWMDCCGTIERERAHVTIFHSFPLRNDRALALFTVDYWVRERDTCTTPFQRHLLTAEPFAGFRWPPRALMKWWSEMTDPGNCDAPPPALDPTQALQAALDWIAKARPYWQSFTREPWPYTPHDLIGYYMSGYVGPQLSPSTPTPP